MGISRLTFGGVFRFSDFGGEVGVVSSEIRTERGWTHSQKSDDFRNQGGTKNEASRAGVGGVVGVGRVLMEESGSPDHLSYLDSWHSAGCICSAIGAGRSWFCRA